MGRMLSLLVVGAITLGATMALAQDRRVALVIGNDAYKTLPKLANAANDARAMDRKLKELGFETILRANAGRREMHAAVNEFSGRVAAGSVGLFYFAGHGIQAGGRNFLIPVDAELQSEDDLEADALDAARVTRAMEEARNPLNIVILDACRDNPLPKRRSASRGLAVIPAPRGLFVAYAAAPGQTALDGAPGGNGLFTAELIRALDLPGLTIEQVFKRVTEGVLTRSSGKQEPWIQASLRGDFFFRPGTPGALAAPPPAPAPLDPAAIELSFWDSIKASNDIADFEEYLRKYPRGQFAGLARNKVRALTPEPQTASVAPPPPSRDPQARPVQPAVGTYPGTARPGQAFRDCPDCPDMVVIPAGSFTMGSPAHEQGRDNDEGPQRNVSIRSFALGKTEVTFAEYDSCAAENACPRASDNNWGRGNRPVINVSWNDAKAYAAWLSRKTGKSYRLPSEAEWEYAARAGTTTRFSCGNDDGCLNAVAWYSSNSGNRTQPVGAKAPNAFGLHDMHGNVWEWTEDCSNGNYNGAPTDGGAWLQGECSSRVNRGGSWDDDPGLARSANRSTSTAVIRSVNDGFRVARTN
ncbi:MAG: hypothetical protein FJX47_08260 [Alphaproteobacteria bacterium]|nr:hypothetical protein [Alphaproteobacteria bacterium]